MKIKMKEIIGVVTLVVCVISCSFLMLTGCGKNHAGTYTITVVSEGGKVFEEVGVYVYTDESLNKTEHVAKTDKEGKISFESENAIGCVVTLKDVPKGYQLDTYKIKEKDTKIVLKTELLDETQLDGVTFKLGDVFADFSVTATDGNAYMISELLQEKEAVVLNFWFLNCDPCRMEFPFLEEAYQEYKDKIEVLAINPVDGTDETVEAYRKKLGLSFPMAACDEEWNSFMSITAYPTTVVIDRYGTIALIHKGTVTEAETFTTIFDYFTAEDYKQTTIRNVEDILE